MKYLKRIENYKSSLYSNVIELYDYVVIEDKSKCYDLKQFIDNNVGQAISVDENFIGVSYENIPDSIIMHFHKANNCKLFVLERIENVIYFSKNKNDAEIFLQSKIFNL